MPNPQQLITDNLDIWTAAIKKRGSQGRGSSKKIELHGIKKLRELILELAVRGLLVPQNPNDEPASVLLEKIAVEKEQLIKDKKIKKQKPLPEISEDEKPFELPKGWAFVRLCELCDLNGGFAFKSSNYTEEGTRVIRISDFDERGFKNDRIVRHEFTDILSQYLLEEQNILMAMTGGTVGKCLLVNKLDEQMVVNQRVATMRFFSDVLPRYMKSVLQTLTVQSVIEEAKNSTNDNISMTDIKGFMVAVPPENEIGSIVAKVDELMALCDQLEQQTETSLTAHQTLVETLLKSLLDAAQITPGHATSQQGDHTSQKHTAQHNPSKQNGASSSDPFQQAWQMIWENFDALFTTESSIDQLKQTILQLAVMGKLVPQNENDEPASVLLEKIDAEKEQLIKDGKIKKQKPLPEISDDERPFALPKGWEWSTLSELNALVTDGDHQAPPKADEGVPFLVIGNLNKGVVDFTNSKYVPSSYYENLDWTRKPCSDDLLYTVTGSYGIPVKINLNKPFCVQRHVAILKATKSTPTEYLAYALSSKLAYEFATEVATGIAQKTVPLTGLRKMPIALPPKAEYKIIVAKVDELMALCDTLKERIRESQTTQLHLANAMAEQALNE